MSRLGPRGRPRQSRTMKAPRANSLAWHQIVIYLGGYAKRSRPQVRRPRRPDAPREPRPARARRSNGRRACPALREQPAGDFQAPPRARKGRADRQGPGRAIATAPAQRRGAEGDDRLDHPRRPIVARQLRPARRIPRRPSRNPDQQGKMIMSDTATAAEFVITRTFNASRERLWEAWTDPAQLAAWNGPKGSSGTTLAADVRSGGERR